jgi:hypothetical protein
VKLEEGIGEEFRYEMVETFLALVVLDMPENFYSFEEVENQCSGTRNTHWRKEDRIWPQNQRRMIHAILIEYVGCREPKIYKWKTRNEMNDGADRW